MFFTDPDGLKLEGMVFKPPRKKKQSRRKQKGEASDEVSDPPGLIPLRRSILMEQYPVRLALGCQTRRV